MKHIALFAALLLTACAPVAGSGYVPPTYGPVSGGTMAALDAARAIGTAQSYAATGDAYGAMAAQATAEHRATQDSLALAITQAVIDERADAATSTAIARNDSATQSAQATATAQANIQMQMQQAISATGTALYWDAQVADARAQSEIMQTRSETTRAESVNDAISGLAWAVAICAGLAAMVVSAAVSYFSILWFHERKEIDREAYQSRQDAETQRLWSQSVKASIVEKGGLEYLLTRRGYIPMLPAPEEKGFPGSKLDNLWRAVCREVCYNAVELARGGENNPFSEPSLTTRYGAIVYRRESGRAWLEGARAIVDLLKAMNILACVKQGGKTTWAAGWGIERFEREFGMLPLPYIPAIDVPGVRVTLRSSEVAEVIEVSEVAKLEFPP